MNANPHDVTYSPPVGKSFGFNDPKDKDSSRGYSADDLAREQLKQANAVLEAQLPALVDLGTQVYVEKIRFDRINAVLEEKLRASLSPEHAKRAREVFAVRAAEALKAEELAKLAALKPPAEPPPAVVAAETRVQSEKRGNRR